MCEKGRGGAYEYNKNEYDEEKALGKAADIAGVAQRKLAVIAATNDIYRDLINEYEHKNGTLDKEIHLLEQMASSNRISIIKFKDMLNGLQERSAISEVNYLTKKNLLDVKKKHDSMLQLNRDNVDCFNKKTETYRDIYKRMPLMKLKTSLLKEANLLEYELMQLNNDIENTRKALTVRNEEKKKRYQSLIVEFANFITKDSKQFNKELTNLQLTTEESLRLNEKLKKEREDLEKKLIKATEKTDVSGASFNCELPILNFEDPFIPLLQLSTHNREENFISCSQREIENIGQATYDSNFMEVQENLIPSEQQYFDKPDTFEQPMDVETDIDTENKKIKIISDEILKPEETITILQQIKKVKFEQTKISGSPAILESTMLPVIQTDTNNEKLTADAAVENITSNEVAQNQPTVSTENNENVPETMETVSVSMANEDSCDTNSIDGNNYFTAKPYRNASSSESNELVDYNPFESYDALLKTREFEISPVNSPTVEIANFNDENPPAGPSKVVSSKEELHQENANDENKQETFSFSFGRRNIKKSTGFFSSLF